RTRPSSPSLVAGARSSRRRPVLRDRCGVTLSCRQQAASTGSPVRYSTQVGAEWRPLALHGADWSLSGPHFRGGVQMRQQAWHREGGEEVLPQRGDAFEEVLAVVGGLGEDLDAGERADDQVRDLFRLHARQQLTLFLRLTEQAE